MDHDELQSTTLENPAIDVMMLLIADVQACGVHVERVRVLHAELPHSQQSRLRARLVAEFLLNLVPDLRQLLIAPQFLARDLGHHLFFGHAQAEVAPAAVLQAKHVVAHQLPAPAGLPNLARMQRRQVKLLPDRIHFFAHHVGDLKH